MRERYFCTVYDCVKAMLPAGLSFSLRDCVVLREGTDREAAYAAAEGLAGAKQLLDLLLSWGGTGGDGADPSGLRHQGPRTRPSAG